MLRSNHFGASGQHNTLIAIDTNVLVRLIVRDDDQQVATARAVLERDDGFVSIVCLLETLWVLQSRYRMSNTACYDAIAAVRAVGRIAFELEEHSLWALARFREGADPADMLLLVAARDQSAFVSFDRRLPGKAGEGTPVAIEILQ